MPPATLTTRALNRALLARQMLLARERRAPLGVIERLVGLQAQVAAPPFIGLWTRIEGFRREHLIRLLEQRRVVRSTLMRGTLHLMSAKDFVAFRPALQPALTRAMGSVLRDRATEIDFPRLLTVARRFFASNPATFDALRDHLASAYPKGDVRALGYAVRTHLPLVQVPSDDPWGFPAKADFTEAETWLDGAPAQTSPGPTQAQRRRLTAGLRTVALRYLTAFGPATPADMQTWSGLPSLGDLFEELRPRLRVFHDDRGRELFDLPKAPRPPEDTTAPVRFIPEYDNLVLSHADRSRIVPDEHRGKLVTRNLQVRATLLVDGFVAGTWRIERSRSTATLVMEPFAAIPAQAQSALIAEAHPLLRFIAPEAGDCEVRFGKT